MAAEDSPAFQFYPKDWLSSSRVMLMSLAEEGAYVRLLCIAWLSGSIPADIPELAKLCRVSSRQMGALWQAVGPCFEPHPEDPKRLVNLRLEEERDKQAAFREMARERGAKGAQGRWKKDASSIHQALPEQCPSIGQAMLKNGSSSPSSSSSPLSLDPHSLSIPAPSPHPGSAHAPAREEQPPRQEAGAPPPDPHVVGGRASPGSNGAGKRRHEDPADDAACVAFGEALLAAWPAGHVNPVRFQRALLDVWRQGLIRADGTDPREPKSRTASQVLADMPLWKAYHDSGARPKHLETYLEQRCFQAPVPQPLKANGGTNGRRPTRNADATPDEARRAALRERDRLAMWDPDAPVDQRP